MRRRNLSLVSAAGLLVTASVLPAQQAEAPSARALADAPILDAFLAVRVRDVEASAAWYARVFDLSEVNRIDGDNFAIRILEGPGLSVELIQQAGTEDPPSRHYGLFKAGLFVADIEAFHAEVRDRGVAADEAIFVDEALGVRSFVMSDLEGNRLQALERCDDACGND